jgi:hypothetical protein
VNANDLAHEHVVGAAQQSALVEHLAAVLVGRLVAGNAERLV